MGQARSTRTSKAALARSLTGVSLGAMSFLMASQASAQTQPPPPPEEVISDSSGIDLASRSLQLGGVDLSIGPNGHHGLQFMRQISDQDWRIATTPVMSGSTTAPIIVWNGGSVSFRIENGAYVPNKANGTSLNNSATIFTAADGTQVHFQAVTGLTEHASAFRAATKIVYPDGVEHIFTYQTGIYSSGGGATQTITRLMSIDSTTGYQIKLQYQSDNQSLLNWRKLSKATAINNKVEYCSPSANVCSLSGTWPQVTYAGGLARATEVTDPEGRTTTIGYTGSRVTSITPPGTGSSSIVYAYSSGGEMDSVTRGGGTWNYASLAGMGGSITVVQDPNGNSSNHVIDGEGRLESTTSGGNTTEYLYNTAGLIERITTPEDNYTTLAYDARGNVTTQTSHGKPGSGVAPITVSATYPSSCGNAKTCNKPTSTADAKGNVTNYTWDATHGGLTKIEAPADASGVRPTTTIGYGVAKPYYKSGASSWTSSDVYVATFSRSCRTAASCVGSANEMVSVFGYPSANTPNNADVIRVERKAGNGTLLQTSHIGHTSLGDIASVDGPLAGTGDKTVMFYNKARQQTGMIGHGDATYAHLASRTTYDDAGRVRWSETGHTSAQSEAALASMTVIGKSRISYDSHSRVISRFAYDLGGNAFVGSQTSYDAGSRVTCVAQRMNPAIYGSLPGNACLQATQGSFGPDRIAKYTYDDRNRVTKVTKGYGTADAVDSYTVTFTPNGRVATAKDAENNLTTYEYDGHDRNYKVRFPVKTKGAATSSNSDYEQYTFDKNGNVTAFRTRAGETLAMSYDNLNRLVTKIVPERSGLSTYATRDVYYAYDLLGNLTAAKFNSHSDSDGYTLGYDGLGRLVSETRSLNGFTTTIGSAYDVRNLRTSMTYPDGKVATYSYDLMGRPDTIKLDGVNVARYTFRQDGLPDKMERWRDNGSWDMPTTFSYNNQSRMTGRTHNLPGSAQDATSTFSYNPAGQITQRSQSNAAYAHPRPSDSNFAYTSNGLNQYDTAATANFIYDANGNLIFDGVHTFTYDIENRLRSRSGGGSSAIMWYDPLGRLYKVDASNADNRYFVYDGDALVMEYDNNGNVMLDRYLHGPGAGIDDPLVGFAGSSVAIGNREYLYADERGSIVALGNASGGITNVNTYDPYGVQAPGNIGRFRYTGQIWIPEMGIYHYKARAYSPDIGRFMQADPIGYGDGMNMYRYVGNDPVNAIDPTGLRGVCVSESDKEKCLREGGKWIEISDDDSRTNDEIVEALNELLGSDYNAWFSGGEGTQSVISGSGRFAGGGDGPRGPIDNYIVGEIPQSNGCGPSGGLALPLFKACDAHDYCYASNRGFKQKCDQVFLDSMLEECGFRPNPACPVIAYSFYVAVRDKGWDAYHDAQEKFRAKNLRYYLRNITR